MFHLSPKRIWRVNKLIIAKIHCTKSSNNRACVIYYAHGKPPGNWICFLIYLISHVLLDKDIILFSLILFHLIKILLDWICQKFPPLSKNKNIIIFFISKNETFYGILFRQATSTPHWFLEFHPWLIQIGKYYLFFCNVTVL